MISVDTNILLYALNRDAPEHAAAAAFIAELGARDDVVLCELVLVELYLLLRNKRVMGRPLSAPKAGGVCQQLRKNPRWAIVESAPVMSEVWRAAARPGFAYRRIIDLRLALTLVHHGVRTFATRNTKDFRDVGFDEVLNPIDSA